jgi:uncharacterized protein
MAETFHHNFFLAGPAGRLEATLWTMAKPTPGLAALVCHPHPLFGGTMHNKVVFRVARTLHALGLPVLRFNFRGAGLSAGEHDQGRGEADDVRAAIAWLAGKFPRRALLLAGFSFGAWVGLRVGCEDERIAEVIGLGLPVNDSDLSYLRGCAKPKLFIQGAQDQYGARERLEALFAALPEPKRLEFVPGADHFFTGKLAAVDRAVRSWLAARHPGIPAEPSRTSA